MNIPESREFVINNRPICCNQRVDELGHHLTSHTQFFVCRKCFSRIEIKYWPLYEKDIRDLKLNSIL